MPRRLSVTVSTFELAQAFTIARGSKREARVVTATIADGPSTGRGECVPYARYGESVEGVVAAIEAARAAIEAGADREALRRLMPAGAARNAVDCALWDLEAKASGIRVAHRLGISAPRPLVTAYTISLGTPDAMAASTRAAAHRALLKIKVGGPEDPACMRAVRAAAPDARLILDANEGWTGASLAENLAVAAEIGAELVEQPLPVSDDGALEGMARPVPVCADESLHQAEDVPRLAGRYDVVNIKLDKAGGLTEALALKQAARECGLKVMVGCMVASSLSMAPAVLLAQDADVVDLDGPLLMRTDRPDGLAYEGSTVSPPSPALWG